MAHAAVKTKGSHRQAVFRRFLPKLGYKGAIWAVAHRLCKLAWVILHRGVRFIEYGELPTPKARKHRAQSLAPDSFAEQEQIEAQPLPKLKYIRSALIQR